MPAITLTLADSGQAMDVRVGDRLALRLEENPATGYQWTMEPLDQEVLTLEHVEYRPARGAGMGGGGQRAWIFLARKPGMATLQLALQRPWEGESSTAKRFTAELRVHE